jgi:hypothetical protein
MRVGLTVAYVKNLQPPLEIRIDAANREPFTIYEHNAIFDPHPVRQRAFRTLIRASSRGFVGSETSMMVVRFGGFT